MALPSWDCGKSRSRYGRAESTNSRSFLPGCRALVAVGMSADSNRCVALEITTLEESQETAVGRRSGAIPVGVAMQMAEAVAHFRASSRAARRHPAGRIAIDEVEGWIAGTLASSATERHRDQSCQSDAHRQKPTRHADVGRPRPWPLFSERRS